MTHRDHIHATPKRWTLAQKVRLEILCDQNVPWDEIAIACGHPKSSCQTTMSFIRRDRRLKAAAAGGVPVAGGRPKAAPVFFQTPLTPLVQAPPEPSGFHHRTSTMVQDAELRSRIAAIGPNGLLGDPMPGRSALDQKRAASGVST